MQYYINKYLLDNNIKGRIGIDYTLENKDGIIVITSWNVLDVEPPVLDEKAAKIDSFEREKEIAIIERMQYINNTNDIALRELDEKGSYPEEIRLKRIKARKDIELLKSASSLDQIKDLQTPFCK